MRGTRADVRVESSGVGDLVAGRDGVLRAGVFDKLVVAAAGGEIVGVKV